MPVIHGSSDAPLSLRHDEASSIQRRLLHSLERQWLDVWSQTSGLQEQPTAELSTAAQAHAQAQDPLVAKPPPMSEGSPAPKRAGRHEEEGPPTVQAWVSATGPLPQPPAPQLDGEPKRAFVRDENHLITTQVTSRGLNTPGPDAPSGQPRTDADPRPMTPTSDQRHLTSLAGPFGREHAPRVGVQTAAGPHRVEVPSTTAPHRLEMHSAINPHRGEAHSSTIPNRVEVHSATVPHRVEVDSATGAQPVEAPTVPARPLALSPPPSEAETAAALSPVTATGVQVASAPSAGPGSNLPATAPKVAADRPARAIAQQPDLMLKHADAHPPQQRGSWPAGNAAQGDRALSDQPIAPRASPGEQGQTAPPIAVSASGRPLPADLPPPPVTPLPMAAQASVAFPRSIASAAGGSGAAGAIRAHREALPATTIVQVNSVSVTRVSAQLLLAASAAPAAEPAQEDAPPPTAAPRSSKPASMAPEPGTRRLTLRELDAQQVLAAVRDTQLNGAESQAAAQELARALMQAGYARVQVVVNGRQERRTESAVADPPSADTSAQTEVSPTPSTNAEATRHGH